MRKLVVAAVASVAALTVVATASADVLLSANQQLHFKGKGGHSWNRIGGDSAYDSNTRALRMWVGNPSAGQYVVAYSQRSLSIAKDAAAVGNLSFEFKTAGRHVGAGAPRISVEFQNGDVAYLSAFYCNHPMAATGNAWSRADFTRFSDNCSFFVSGDTGGQYSADGSRSAWKVYADAHPSQVVEQAYLVGDETGSYRIDRLSLGAGAMYTAGNRVGKLCTTEASC
jgi:hypothetical protein